MCLILKIYIDLLLIFILYRSFDIFYYSRISITKKNQLLHLFSTEEEKKVQKFKTKKKSLKLKLLLKNLKIM